jgi:hypothetical protein
MNRYSLRWIVVSVIFLLLGAAVGAAIFFAIPASGSAPSIYDDFNWSSTANGFWHVNPVGATDRIKNGTLTLSGHSIELDRRLQTDPNSTVAVARVRGLSFDKFALGLGVYHSGTISLEFDSDGVKCGRGTDHGWQIDILKPWTTPPVSKWFYVGIKVVNPYPDPKVLAKLGDIDPDKLKPVTLTCALWDSSGHLIASDTPTDPKPNTHYAALDEAYVRTWDSKNKYQIDWLYAGPPSGIPHGVTFK